ncbi:hypothetical protein NFJ02_36g91080 [Pycnococcus provasolii]
MASLSLRSATSNSTATRTAGKGAHRSRARTNHTSYSRAHSLVVCVAKEASSAAHASAAGKGFGASSSSKGSGGDGGSRRRNAGGSKKQKNKPAVAVELDPRDDETKEMLAALTNENLPKGVAPVDPEVAKKGRVDFATIDSWSRLDGDGLSDRDEKVMNLPITSHDEMTPATDDAPLYEQLVSWLSVWEKNGTLSTAGPPPPPPDKWRWSADDYAAYLRGRQKVHEVLETMLQDAADAAKGSAGATATAVNQFAGKVKPLARAQCFAEDGKALVELRLEGKACTEEDMPHELRDYISFLERLGNAAKRGEAKARIQLAAHAACAYMTHLGSGALVGARAVSMLHLENDEGKGVSAFASFPELVNTDDDPIRVLRESIDDVGSNLSAAGRKEFIDEAKRAMRRCGLLLQPLAVAKA